MNAQHERVLGIIADLAEDGKEVDEYSVAQLCGAIPDNLPRHAWVNHPSRGELLRIFSCLDQGKLIYLTRRGYWGMHITQRGRQVLEGRPQPTTEGAIISPLYPDQTPQREEELVWQAPRPDSLEFAPRQDHFYSTLALAVAGLGVLLIFAFGQSSFSPLARDSAAAGTGGAIPTAPIALPPPPTATVPPTPAATAPPAMRAFVVANTGGDGVYMRRTPKIGDRLAAWTDGTRLEEIGPEQVVEGVSWRHVRAPDGSEGFVPGQYTTVVP